MNECGNLITCAVAWAPHVFDAAFAIIAAASAVTALTPTPRDDAWVGRIYRLVDTLALNVGHAKEKAPESGGRFTP